MGSYKDGVKGEATTHSGPDRRDILDIKSAEGESLAYQKWPKNL